MIKRETLNTQTLRILGGGGEGVGFYNSNIERSTTVEEVNIFNKINTG